LRDRSKRLNLVVLVGDGAGDAFGVGVVSGRGQRLRDRGERLNLVVLVCDAAGEFFGGIVNTCGSRSF
jgi:hypothetical protein